MTKNDAKLVAAMISDQASYGDKEHPVRLSTLHDCAESWRMYFSALGPQFREAFDAALTLPAIPAETR